MVLIKTVTLWIAVSRDASVLASVLFLLHFDLSCVILTADAAATSEFNKRKN